MTARQALELQKRGVVNFSEEANVYDAISEGEGDFIEYEVSPEELARRLNNLDKAIDQAAERAEQSKRPDKFTLDQAYRSGVEMGFRLARTYIVTDGIQGR